jgi:hypothetical protein
MQFHRFLVRTGLVLSVAALMAGCDTMDRSVQNVKERVGSIQMPEIPHFWAAQKEEAMPCPQVILVEELRAIHQFKDANHPKPGEKVSSGYFSGAGAACQQTGNNLVVQLTLHLRGELGQTAIDKKSPRPSFSYPYFVAVTDAGGNVVAKEIFAANISYDAGQSSSATEENIREIVPLSGTGVEKGYSIMIGFQLSDGELAYNRSLLNAEVPPEMAMIAPTPAPEADKPAAKKTVKKKIVKKETGAKKKAAAKPAPAKAKIAIEARPAGEPLAAPAPATATATAAPVTPADAANAGAPVYTDGPIVIPPTADAPAPGSAAEGMMNDEMSAPPSVDQNEVIFSSDGGKPEDQEMQDITAH